MEREKSVGVSLLADALLNEWGDELMRAWQEEQAAKEAAKHQK